jgi:hypothetical protein
LLDEDQLIEKLRKIEALFARPGTEGERLAAGEALHRIRSRLRQLESSEPTVEIQFSLPDTWSRSLFIALLRRYDLRPYRYPGQRRTTVVVRVTRSFVDGTLWPEFRELNETLRCHLDQVTQRVIEQAIFGDVSDAEVMSGQGSKTGRNGPAAAGQDLKLG